MSAVVYCVVVALLLLGSFGIVACLGGYEAQRDNAEDVRLGLRKEAP